MQSSRMMVGWGLLAALISSLGVAGTAEAVTRYVSTTGDNVADGLSWATAKRTVQAGLNAAEAGDEVWVAVGTYVENIRLKSGVALYGGFAGIETALDQRNWTLHVTILDGNEAGSVVTAPTGATEATRIDGFTIRNGIGTVTGGLFNGGGIYCYKGSSPTIANNTIAANRGVYGGGIYCSSGMATITNNTIMGNSGQGAGIYCLGGSPTITGNTITGNSFSGAGGAGGGISCSFHSSAMIVNNTITGNSAGRGGGIFCEYSSPMIAGNTITGNDVGGIYCHSSSPTIVNNTIRRNRAGSGGGISCDSDSSPMIANNVIAENSANQGGGIYCRRGSPTIANNTITGNTAVYDGGGICCSSFSSSTTIVNTIIAFNSSGIYYGSTGTPILRYNCVYGNAAYNYSHIADPTGTEGNISADPKLADIAYGNAHIQPDSPCIDVGDDTVVQPGWLDTDGQARIQGDHVDIGADESDGTVWAAGPYVVVRVNPDGDDANDGSTWALAKRTVQAGIDLAATLGGEVWVRAGTYNERITLHPYVYLYGGFAGTETVQDERDWAAHITILDGQEAGTVVSFWVCGQVSAIDGFTIRNGNAMESSSFTSGGGISCLFSSPTIANNTIIASTASTGGGIYSSYSSPTIVNNAITGNDALSGGGIYFLGLSSTIANNRITGNSAASYGGGIYCSGFSVTIANNTITGNSVVSGGGGGIYCSGGSPTIANNTITENSASSDGGGINCYNSSPAVFNTLIALNTSGIYKNAPSAPTLHYNCVHGNTAYNYAGLTDPTGTDGNISADPKLADLRYGNAHLQPDSPCVDAGDDTVVQSAWSDLDGEARIQGSRVDMGADESDGTVWAAGPYMVVRVSPDGDDANNGSTWALARRTVQAGIDLAATLGGEVWVRAGTYHERITLHPYAYLYGGFAGSETARDERDWTTHTTILDGQAAGSVVTALAGWQVSAIDGFTIRNGNALFGGGILSYALSLTITNNTITGNRAYWGGGMCCYYGSSPTIANNIITGNIATYDGGGIDSSHSSATIANNTITGNIASRGGGISCYRSYSRTTITNTIIAFNSSGIHNRDTGTPVLRYNCVYGNTDYNYSGVTDPTGSNGNISAVPLFVNPGGDYRLGGGSPCIDAGDNTGVPTDITDLDGDGDTAEPLPFDLAGLARFVDDFAMVDTGAGSLPIVDMGAYEYQAPARADFDADGDVDVEDMEVFEACATGPDVPYDAAGLPEPSPGCTLAPHAGNRIAADFDDDGDVDQYDFAMFQRCVSGPNVPVNPVCGR